MRIPYFNDWLSSFVSLCAPPRCLQCGEHLFEAEALFCLHCEISFPQSPSSSARENEITQLLRPRFQLHSAIGLFQFESGNAIQSLLHCIKYEDHKDAALRYGKKLGRRILSCEESLPKKLIPVPLHPKKLKIRGFNQSERIAMGISSVTGIPVDGAWLIRTDFQQSQTQLGRMQRWKNIQSSFACSPNKTEHVRHLALVDDMITTGSTLEACAQALQAKKLSVYSLAYEP